MSEKDELHVQQLGVVDHHLQEAHRDIGMVIRLIEQGRVGKVVDALRYRRLALGHCIKYLREK